MRTRIGLAASSLFASAAASSAPGAVGKATKKRVPLRVDLDAAVRAERPAQDAAVLRQRVGVLVGAELVQERRSPRRR
jgi:hypothetical protein